MLDTVTSPVVPPLREVAAGGVVTARDVADVACGRARVVVDLPRVHGRLQAARKIVQSVLDAGIPAYGVNRGLGPMRDSEIPADLMSDFQRFVIVSHAAAIGPPISRVEGRAVLFTRLCTLAAGASGVSQTLFDGLLDLLTHDVVPVIPAEGSVGAADLSQMAAVGLVLLGGGRAWLPGEDRIVSGAEALHSVGLKPIELAAKDGLALVGSNALSIAAAAMTKRRTDLLASRADDIAAMTVEALDGNLSPFDEIALAARPHAGQALSGRRVRAALAGGDLARGNILPVSVQDPISIRTVPQVHGTLVDQLYDLERLIDVELGSAPDNPYLDVENGRFVSNGNFSITNIAVAFDALRITLAHVAMLSERRIALLVRRLRSDRPLIEQIQTTVDPHRYVTPFIFAQTASALVASVKHLAAPVSLTGTTVGDGVEDHNSMAYPAVRVTAQSLDSLERLLAVEALLASSLLGARSQVEPRALGRTVARLVERVQEVTSEADVTSADVVAGVAGALASERDEDDLNDPCERPLAGLHPFDQDGGRR